MTATPTSKEPIGRVDPANTEQARSWDGDQGSFWAANADHFDRTVAAYHDRLMTAAAIAHDERVLDIGCGTGQTTRDAARVAGGGWASGVDLSARMIELARQRAVDQGLTNVEFQHTDAQIHPFRPGSFDSAISRMGTMFFGDVAAAFANIGRALRPGGHLTILVWQGPEPNEWLRELNRALAADRELPSPPIGTPGPFAQADPDQVRAILTAAGFKDVEVTGLQAPIWFGTDAEDAQRFVLGLMGWMLDGLDNDRRRHALHNLAQTLTTHDTAQGILFESAAWLIRARRGTSG